MGRQPRLEFFIFFVIKLMLQIAFQTSVTFLFLWLILFSDRWENYRLFLTRTSSFYGDINTEINSFSIIMGVFVFAVFPGLNLGKGEIFTPTMAGDLRKDQRPLIL